MRSPVAIALSGGVDSMVAAALLKDQGCEVIGLHFLTGYESMAPPPDAAPSAGGETASPDSTTAEKVAAMADRLAIPLHVVDLRAAFQHQVVDYFIQGYGQGSTPNPCLVCNPAIKFGHLLTHAHRLGAQCLATGHYARIETAADGRRRLLRGVDPVKDQSYFLARLSQDQLCRAVLPLGDQTKARTRRIAVEKGLRPSVAEESQDICFIHDGAYGEFLQTQPGFASRPGPIQTVDGEVIGRHEGLHLFTVGQRRGINCPAARPYYVVRIDTAANRLIVGFKEDLAKDRCNVAGINWIIEPPRNSLAAQVRLRYRHTAAPARVVPESDTTARVIFEQPQTAITPGQGAVFYRDDEVLGGGWIQ